MKDVRKIIDIDYSFGLFVPLSLLVMIQCILATLDIEVYWVSTVVMIIALVLSYKDLKGIIVSIQK